ncbi:MAG: hypothetical protein QE487_13155 [Fluviicola sp.]|nr:hypothetical protein [Fluviicola sp.]
MSYSIHLKLIATAFTLVAICFNGQAQETKPENRSVEIALTTGFGDSYWASLSDATWNKYTPDFVIPTDSSGYLQGFSTGYPYGNPYTVSSYLLGSVHVSYKNAFLDAKKIRSSVGLVFGSGIGYRSDQSWTKSESFTIDTLTSSQTGEQYIVDSTHNHGIGRSYEANDFMIGVSHFFQTNPLRRFSLHLGITASYGFSVNARMSTYQYDWSAVTPSLGVNDNYESTYYRTEMTDAPKSNSLTLQLPVELSFRPWKNGKMLQGLSLALAYRPTLKHFVIADQKATNIANWYGVTMRLVI